MLEEIDSLKKNHIYGLVKLSNDKRGLNNRWLFKIKVEDSAKP